MRRLRITIVGLCVLVLAYRVYAITMIPWIEPPSKASSASTVPQGSVLDFATEERTNFREFLPADAWELAKSTSVLESTQGALAFMHHESLEDGTIKLWPLTLVYYSSAEPKPNAGDSSNAAADSDPSAAAPSAGQPKTPIFIQAPEGAILETDKPINLARLDVGDPVSARLLGEVTIHRPNSGGPDEEDDSLWLVTRNLKVTQTQIITPQRVEFRFGPHSGYGEDLEIELTKASQKRREQQVAFGRIRNLTLHRLEKVRLMTEDGMLRRAVAEKKAPAAGRVTNSGPAGYSLATNLDRRPPNPNQPAAARIPIEITSSGPFRFDLTAWRASLTGDVRVSRLEEPFRDTIECHRLMVLLHEPAEDDTNLSVNKLIAEGLPNRPVHMNFPSQQIAGRGHRLTCYYDERRILLEDLQGEGRRAWFRHQETEVEVPVLDYRLHPDSPRRLGEFDGKGPGVLRSVVERDNRDLPLVMTWATSVQIRPMEGPDLRVVRVFGKSHVEVIDTGTFDARELHLFVREQPKPNSNDRWRIVPDQLLARGDVRITSKRLTGTVDEMRVWFVPDEDQLPEPIDEAILPAPRDATVTNAGFRFGAENNLATTDDREDGLPVHVQGARLHARVLRGNRPQLDDVTILASEVVDTGQPAGSQLANRVTATKPLGVDSTGRPRKPFVVQGNTIQISQIQTDDPIVRVRGNARIAADDVQILGDRVFVSGQRNKLWIYGEGNLFAPPRRASAQHPLQPGEQVHVRWKESLVFDGEVATIQDQVTVDGSVRAEKTNDVSTFHGDAQQVRLRLNRAISFLQPPRREQTDAIAIQSIRFLGEASAVNVTRDPFNVQLSHDEVKVRDLELWPETGDLTGGAGWFSTVRYGQSFDSGGGSSNRLTHVEVHFSDGVDGNFEKNDITFHGDVHTIAGPVENWRHRLDPNSPAGLGKDGFEIFSDRLRGVEFTVGDGKSMLELIADGNVRVHNVQFSAFADRMTYNDSKDLITLRGIGPGRHARVESRYGGSRRQGDGRQLQIWPKRRHVEWEGIQRLEFGGRSRNSR